MAGSERPAPLKLDITVDRECPEQDLRKIFSTIRPEWKEESEIKFDACPGTGFVNSIKLVTYKGNTAEGVVARIFLPTYEDIMKREREVSSLQVFNKLDLTPNLYCIFNNGICMEYIQGERFDWEQLSEKPLRDEKITKAAARELAKYHSKKTSDMAKEMFPELFPFKSELKHWSEEFLTKWPETLGNEEADELFHSKYPSKEKVASEWKTLFSMMEGLGVPLTICHYDAHPSNMLYRAQDDRVIFVDYEMSSFCWPTFDLATFLEFSAIGIPAGETFPDRHPESHRKMFLREYLETKRSLGDLDHDVTDLDVERLFVQTEKTTLPFYLFYIGCGLMGAMGPEQVGFPKKDSIQLALNEYDWYERNRERILAMEVPH